MECSHLWAAQGHKVPQARKETPARKGTLAHKAVLVPLVRLVHPAPQGRRDCISSAMTPALPAIIAT